MCFLCSLYKTAAQVTYPCFLAEEAEGCRYSSKYYVTGMARAILLCAGQVYT